MFLNKIPEDKIGELNIPTGIPLVYEFSDDGEPIRNYYLSDPQAAKRAAQAVAEQPLRAKVSQRAPSMDNDQSP
jgi:2,3-bisphosphoglycerate-dependent phosphoglycerate mutase